MLMNRMAAVLLVFVVYQTPSMAGDTPVRKYEFTGIISEADCTRLPAASFQIKPSMNRANTGDRLVVTCAAKQDNKATLRPEIYAWLQRQRKPARTGALSHAEVPVRGFPHLIGVEALAERLNVEVSWVYEYIRARSADPIPHYAIGKYAKFDLDDPELYEWLQRRRKPQRSVKERGESQRKEKNG